MNGFTLQSRHPKNENSPFSATSAAFAVLMAYFSAMLFLYAITVSFVTVFSLGRYRRNCSMLWRYFWIVPLLRSANHKCLSYSFTISCVKVYSILFASSILFPLILEKERKNSKKVHKQALAHLWTSFFCTRQIQILLSYIFEYPLHPFQNSTKKSLENPMFSRLLHGDEGNWTPWKSAFFLEKSTFSGTQFWLLVITFSENSLRKERSASTFPIIKRINS